MELRNRQQPSPRQDRRHMQLEINGKKTYEKWKILTVGVNYIRRGHTRTESLCGEWGASSEFWVFSEKKFFSGVFFTRNWNFLLEREYFSETAGERPAAFTVVSAGDSVLRSSLVVRRFCHGNSKNSWTCHRSIPDHILNVWGVTVHKS